MKARKSGYLSLMGLMLAAFAVSAQAAECSSVQFSEAVLARFPNIAKACYDVIEKQGQEYAVIKADLIRTDQDALYVRVKHPDGSRSDTRRIPVDRDFRVVINGSSVGLDQVAVGQELTTYVKVSEPVVAMALDRDEIQTAPLLEPAVPLPVAAVAANTPPPPPMPRTASLVPAMGLAGVVLLAVGLLLGWSRREARVQDRRH